MPDHVTLDQAVTRAMMAALLELAPESRVAFVLHDVFGLPFTAVADVTGRRPSEARELAKAARTQIHSDVTNPPLDHSETSEHRRIVEDVRAACADGDGHSLGNLLDPFVRVFVDRGLAPEPRSVLGRHAGTAAVLNALSHPDSTLSTCSVNGRAGILRARAGGIRCVAAFDVRGSRIVTVWLYSDEQNLRSWT